MVNKSKKSKSDKEYLLAKEKAKKQKIKVTYMKNGKRCYKTTEMLENEMKKKETGAGSSCEKCCLCKTRDALYKIKKLDCYLDSKLVVEQLNKNWKIKDPGLQKLFVKAYNLTHKFDKVSFNHIRREKNTQADALVNKALDANT